MDLKFWFIAVLLLAVCVGSSLQEEQGDSKVRRKSCPKGKHRKCFSVRYGNRRRLLCRCVPRYYGDEAEKDWGAKRCLYYDPANGRCIIHEL
ncbi:hypothetical protein ACROYT_G022069 [Oculina patagonica]